MCSSDLVVTLPSAIYVLFGQNIGTCITAILASIGSERNAKRATLIHLLFNVIGTVIFVAISMTTPFVHWMEGPDARQCPSPNRQRSYYLQRGDHLLALAIWGSISASDLCFPAGPATRASTECGSSPGLQHLQSRISCWFDHHDGGATLLTMHFR